MILKLHRTLGVLLIFTCVLYEINLSEATEGESEIGNGPSKITLLEKYKCATADFVKAKIKEKEKNETTTTSKPVERDSNLGGQNKSIKLSCVGESVVYVNVTAAEFLTGESKGELELPHFERKFGPNTFCIVSDNSTTFTPTFASGPTTKLKLALCEHDKEHVNHHHDDVAPSSIYSNSIITIRKCCLPNQRLDVPPPPPPSINESDNDNDKEDYVCVAIPTDARQREWKPAIFKSTSDDYSKHIDLEDFKAAQYVYGFPNCSKISSLNNDKDIWFMLLESGSVQVGLKFWFKPVWLPVVDNEFCLDEVVDHDPSMLNATEIDSHSIYHKNQILRYCEISHFDNYLLHRRIFGGLCCFAAFIVFVLLCIYVAIWDKQNLAGWTQFNIFVALFFVVLMEGLRTLLDPDALMVESTRCCVIIAAIAQYFFFALNTTWTVMCFDLFYMFWKLETTSKNVARYRNRLIAYLLFSWGLPLIVVCLAFYLSHSYATEEMEKMEGVYAFAHRRCSSPIRNLGFQTQGIMFLLNLLLFLLTTGLIWRHRRGINPAKLKSRNERHTWRSVTLFLKLVVVMGVISLSVPVDYFFISSEPLSTVAVCFRSFHFIPFFAVFFIFGVNERNMALIKQKFPRFGKYFGSVVCGSGSTESDTANHSKSANRLSDHPSTPT